MTDVQWNDGNARCFGMLLDGRAQETGVKRRGEDATVLMVYNSHHDVVNFTLPTVPEGLAWEGLVDTNQPDAQPASYPFGTVYAVTGRSLVAFGLAASAGPLRTRRLHEAVDDA
jgi:isoamylase